MGAEAPTPDRQRRILVVDEATAAFGLKLFLEDRGYTVETASTGQAGVERFAGGVFDVVVADLLLPDIRGFDLLEKLKAHDPAAEVIVITGDGSMSGAVGAVEAGAFYFIQRPFEPEALRALVDRALEHRWVKAEAERLRHTLLRRELYCGIVGHSKPMQHIFDLIEAVAKSDANILIAGESGTGKELIANAVHLKSLRAKHHFVKINCAALPKELIENELFGHVKGAFTGADREKPGLIEAARGGSLLLDEIAEMPTALQPKLLRVLQERRYQRLGSEQTVEADFRLISSTNRRPSEALDQGLLRADLYYRIATITIEVPPLRERPEDIPLLADRMLKRQTEKYSKPVAAFTSAAAAALLDYHWPGNVRELENVVERAVLLSSGASIKVSDLHFRTRPALATGTAPSVPPRAAPALPTPSAEVSGENGSFCVPFGMSLDEIERRVIEQALYRTGGNKQAAATSLGIYRARLYTMLKKYGLG